jgi:succinate dehydrogenase / fumarate reductase cytochrome b subunit
MKSESPLSPHLQVYKWQLSSLLSITHRMTSVFNLAGLSFFALWIFLLFFGENTFSYFEIFASMFIGKFVFVGITWSFSYHLLNGIRHLFWDIGYGYDLKTANLSGVVVLSSSFILTFLVWVI